MGDEDSSVTRHPAAGGAVQPRPIDERDEIAERYAKAFESAAIGMALIALDGRFIEVNPALCDLVGYAAHELLGKPLQNITHPDDLATKLDNARRMLAGEIRTCQFEQRYLRRGGDAAWVSIDAARVDDPKDRPLCFVLQIQDIGARRQNESQIVQLNRALEQRVVERTARLHFESRLTAISTRLLNLAPEWVDEAVTDALGLLGDALEVDRATVSMVDPQTGQIRITHSWASQPQYWIPLGIGEGEFPWAASQTRAARPVIFSRVHELPAEAASDLAILERFGICSLALLPLRAGGNLLGTVHFSTVTREIHWPDVVVHRLRLIGDIFANVLLRRDKELALRGALARVEDLTERLEAENAYLREDALDPAMRGNIVGESNAVQNVHRRIEQVAPTATTVLVLGETGVGKELVAKAIHERSPRRNATFVKVNCAALPATLIESELFGHEKGSFTGATARKLGRFEVAHGGTIFLDEIGELPLELQAKLLRVLQDGDLERLGSHRTVHVDVRVIAATNRDLKAAIANGTFRSDLYYRLAVFPVDVPPLRARSEDIPLLVWYFLTHFRSTLRKTIEKVPAAAMQRLAAYSWPGNIRELRNVIEHAVIVSPGTTLLLDDVFDASPADRVVETTSALPTSSNLEELERTHIINVLDQCSGRIRGRGQAAERLGLHPSTLYSRMKKLGIQRS